MTVFVCDGSKLCALLPGSATADRFAAAFRDGARKASEALTERSASGAIELPGGGKARPWRRASERGRRRYELRSSPEGELTGASAAGVGLTGRSTLPGPGAGSLELADGRRLRFWAPTAAGDSAIGVEAGRAPLMVLTDDHLSGAGRDGDCRRAFLIRSIKK